LAGPCLWSPLSSTLPCGHPTKMRMIPRSKYCSKRTFKLKLNCLLSLTFPADRRDWVHQLLQVLQSVERIWVHAFNWSFGRCLHEQPQNCSHNWW
jgi:hypothetical protein